MTKWGFAPQDDKRGLSLVPYDKKPVILSEAKNLQIHCFWKHLTHFDMKYVCNICGYIYDPAVGDPDGGIAPGTAFEDIPADWVCPVCGVGKDDFSPAD